MIGLDKYDFSGLRVLVVDRSESVRDLLITALRSFGFGTVGTATSANAAMSALLQDPMDIVLMDRDLAPFDGIEMIRQIRADLPEPTRYVPVILVAAFETESQVLEARDAGATEIVARPFASSSVLRALINIVDNPRPFIETDAFFGPCRRRRSSFDYTGPERRGGDGMDQEEAA